MTEGVILLPDTAHVYDTVRRVKRGRHQADVTGVITMPWPRRHRDQAAALNAHAELAARGHLVLWA